MKTRKFRGRARVVTDTEEIADFLSLRLQRHPRMMGWIMRTQGYPASPSRQQLETYAKGCALVIIRTEERPGV